MQFPEELQPRTRPRPGNRPPCLNEVQFPEELQHCDLVGEAHCGDASMKCSSRRNCSCPFSMARISWPLRRLRERSVRRTKANAHKTASLAPYGCNLNDSCPRALRRPLVAPERSRQATSGPSGVMVLVSPT